MFYVGDKVATRTMDRIGTITAVSYPIIPKGKIFLVFFGDGDYRLLRYDEMSKDKVEMADMMADLQNEISGEQAKKNMLQLKDYIAQLQKQERVLDYLAVKTKEQKAIKNKLSQSYIPDLLLECGMDGVSLATGEKVTVKSDCSVTVKDEYEFFKYLENKGGNDDAMIKDTMVITKPSKELKKMVREFIAKENEEAEEEYLTEYDCGRKINTGTLKAYCLREVQKPSEEIPEDATEKQLEEIKARAFPPESINLFVFKKTKIK